MTRAGVNNPTLMRRHKIRLGFHTDTKCNEFILPIRCSPEAVGDDGLAAVHRYKLR